MMRVDSVTLPLRFILSGLVALVLGIGAIVIRPEVLATYHYNQWVIAVAHTFVLGWITSIIMGAMYQLVPVALETKLHSSRLAGWQFGIHLIGWTGMVAMLWQWNLKWAGQFGVTVAVSMLLFIYNMVRTMQRVPKWNVIATGIASALAWLTLTLTAGLFVIASKVWSFSPFDPMAQMHAHAHAGGIGFFLIMLVAVSYKLVPMFALSELQSENRAGWSLALLNVGLLVSFVLILAGSRFKPLGATIISAGLLLYGIELVAIVRARKRRQLDLPLKQFLVSVALLGPLSILGIVLSWARLPATALTTQLENVYGLVALLGVLTLGILGMLYKIVPFLVWYFSYSRHIGRSKVPSLAELSSGRLQVVGFVLYLPGLALLAVGALFGSESLVRAGAVVLLASVGVFIVNIALMLAHLRWPRLQPLVRPPQGPAGLNPKHAL